MLTGTPLESVCGGDQKTKGRKQRKKSDGRVNARGVRSGKHVEGE